MKNGRLKKLIFVVATLGCFLSLGQAQTANDTKKALAPIKKLEFQGADIRSVIYFLADYGGVNVVVAPKVEGTVTISVKNVTWEQGLDIIGRTYGLAIVKEDAGYYRVLPAVDYRDEERQVNEHLLSKENLTTLDTRIIRIGNSTAENISKAIKGLMTSRGKVTADSRTNSIILQEVPDKIDRIVDFISELDAPPRQIKISAQLIEVNTDYLSEIGVFIGFNATTTSGSATISNSATSDGSSLVTSPFGEYTFSIVDPDYDIMAKVAALVADGKGKIIAHPEITTIENSEARIQMGQKIPIKQFDQSGNVTTVFEEVGTILTVTPHITSDNMILMKLRPERSFAEIGPQGVVISTNNAETNVIVRDGQTSVIGGLTTQDEVESEVGIPLLKDIPIIGNLFRYKKKTRVSRDLIIFVTPTIIPYDLATVTPPSTNEETTN